VNCTIFAECNESYEACKADEGCAPLIGCALGCWNEDDAEECFMATCQCGPPELPIAILSCVVDHCSQCAALAC
jgi:hypothetical protein